MYREKIRCFVCISRLDEDLAFSFAKENDDDESVLDKFPNLAARATYECGLGQSVGLQHWLFEWQQPILLDYAARSSACIVSDEAMISECSVDAYAHELSALTIVHTYSARSKKCSGYYRAPHEIIGIFRSILRPSSHIESSLS